MAIAPCGHQDGTRVRKGLCNNCYRRHLYEKNPETRARRIATTLRWRAANLDRYRLTQRNKVLRQSGWNVETYREAWYRQKGKCANPGCRVQFESPEFTYDRNNLCADHDHKTGKPRGLLCRNCNTALGMVSDDGLRLAGLIEYLQAHGVGADA